MVTYSPLDALLQRNRLEIIAKLLEEPTYTSELARKLELDRTTLTYHLDVLKKAGLVKQEYKVLKKPNPVGKAGSFYEVDVEKLSDAIEELRKLLPNL